MIPSLTRRVFGWLAGLVLTSAAGLAAAQASSESGDKADIAVLAAHPIVVSLAETLADGAGIEIVRAAPSNLPYTRWSAYFAGRGAAALARDAARVDAVLTLRSLWPGDPLYPLARRANIRVVEIDAARPVDGALPGVALQAAPRHGDSPLPLATQPWLSPTNLGRMADIVAADLHRLSPDAGQALESNLAAFKQRLVALTAETEAALAAAPNISVVVVSDRLDYLVSALNLDAVPFTHAGAQWDKAVIEQFVVTVQDIDAAAVLYDGALPQEVQQALGEASPGVALLALEPATTASDVEKALQRVVQALTRSS